MRLFGLDLDVSRPWPWLVALGVLAVGFAAFRRTWPIVGAAWAEATAATRGASRS
jgi:hypothetical protein